MCREFLPEFQKFRANIDREMNIKSDTTGDISPELLSANVNSYSSKKRKQIEVMTLTHLFLERHH
jgi:hypothetical protein